MNSSVLSERSRAGFPKDVLDRLDLWDEDENRAVRSQVQFLECDEDEREVKVKLEPREE